MRGCSANGNRDNMRRCRIIIHCASELRGGKATTRRKIDGGSTKDLVISVGLFVLARAQSARGERETEKEGEREGGRMSERRRRGRDARTEDNGLSSLGKNRFIALAGFMNALTEERYVA